MPNPINAVIVLDTSSSMTAYGYVAVTVIDSKAFVNCAKAGDKIGVVNYDRSGNVAFPFTLVDNELKADKNAAEAIQRLVFNGGHTNIGGGIVSGKGMLDNAPNPRGMVLLTDGYQNYGTNPLTVLPTGYPIFACAMGPTSDQNLLRQIAAGTTGGRYYYAPYVVDMMQIYNQIRGLNPRTQIIANKLSNITPQNYELIPATVSRGNSEAQFVVTWTDASFVYTSGIPTGNKLSITLVDPNGNVIQTAPTVIGSGYVVFDLPNPIAGQWYVQVEYPGTNQALPVTVGVFEFQSDADSSIALEVTVPDTINAGEPLPCIAKVTDDGDPVTGLSIHAEISQPVISLSNAVKLYSDQLGSVQPAAADEDDGMPDDLARLKALRMQQLPETDILPTRFYAAPLQMGNDNHYGTVVNETAEAGSYNLHVRVTGHSSKSDTPFQRCQLVSVLVK
ncbi:MAG TPA: VWA domain-containing protein [Pyrinomonadaceae bacterium]|jgi:hypothetical protein